MVSISDNQVRTYTGVILVFIYVISPYDVISESHYGLYGVIDDVIVLLLLTPVLSWQLGTLDTLWVLYVIGWCAMTSWSKHVCPQYAVCQRQVTELGNSLSQYHIIQYSYY